MTQAIEIAMIGSGNVGGALGVRLARAGYAVTFGTRGDRDVGALLQRADGRAKAAGLTEAVRGADVVILAVPGGAAVQAVQGLGDLSGKIVVDCTNPLRWDAGPVWTPPPQGSNAAAIADAAPGARVIKAFNTFGAEFHDNPELGGGTGANVFVAGDDEDARATVAELAERAGFAPVDAGPLRNAAVLENVAILWIHLAMVGGRGRDFTVQLVPRGS